MKFGSRQMIFGAISTLVVCLLSVGWANALAAQAAQQPKPQMAEEIFKNIPVIKGIPVDEFMDTMGMFSNALAMNCTDCHRSDSTSAWANFAKDTPLKMMARRMALISPESLMATKLAINRGADAAGFRNAIRAGLDVLAPLYAARTEVGMKFDEIREKEGLGAALKWRAEQFKE